jgi:hypothetical protein
MLSFGTKTTGGCSGILPGVEVFHQTSPAGGLKDSTGFNVGATYDISETWHLLASVGTGLQNRTTTNQLSYYVAVQSRF